jgi:pimeloyl-ACP methyl ester carboxylesterase
MRFMASWGLEKHSADVRSIVSRLQPALSLPYEVLGHSYGAITALDYAARYTSELAPARVIALDINVLDGEAEPKLSADAKRTYDAHVQLLERGTYVDTDYALLKPVKDFAVSTPNLSSGTSRADYGHSGTFTFEQLLFATLLDSSRAAGVHTEITQLPGDWLFKGGAVAGRYKFADDPGDDRYAFTLTRYDTFLETVDATGSGLIAVALERDVWALNADLPGYRIDWSAIKQPVIWINSEFGYGRHRHGAALMRAAGNGHVLDEELLGYGHGDLLWAETARIDLWEKLLP